MTKTDALAAISARRRDRRYLREHLTPEWQEKTRAYLERLDIRDRTIAHEIRVGVRRYGVDD